MEETSLQTRLKQHSDAFESLLSLIPAKLYYGEETNNEQWKRKKQTKGEKDAARRNKLDPDSALNRNAKEVMDERARSKRKANEMARDEQEEDDEDDEDEQSEGASSDGDDIVREKPLEGLKRRRTAEKLEADRAAPTTSIDDSTEKKPLTERQQERLLKRQEKLERKAERKREKAQAPAAAAAGGDHTFDASVEASAPVDDEASSAVKPLLATEGSPRISEPSQTSPPQSPIFDGLANEPAETASTMTSASSGDGSERPKSIKVPSDTTALRARLAAKIAAMRAARHADDADGNPIRTRQDLIESRRKKEMQRKAHKQELRKKAKEAEEQKREEALASARASPMMSFGSPMPTPPASAADNSFSFGRVAFADGSQMSRDLSYIKEAPAKKGPVDAKGALAKLEASKLRLSGMDADKRKEVLEKETWLAARRKIEGNKVRDDEKLLKNTVKRKEKLKKKSEKEWNERKEGVEQSIKARQAKREANLNKRKEDKQLHKLGGKKKGKGGSAGAPRKNRPGFEGSGFGKRR